MKLALNPDKTFLGVQRGVLLGYVVSEKGREADTDKICRMVYGVDSGLC